MDTKEVEVNVPAQEPGMEDRSPFDDNASHPETLDANEVEKQAAVEAGFTSASTIGTYLRELIARHQDTLAVAVR